MELAFDSPLSSLATSQQRIHSRHQNLYADNREMYLPVMRGKDSRLDQQAIEA